MKVRVTMLSALLLAAAPTVTSRTSPLPPRPPPRRPIESVAFAPAPRLPSMMLLPLLLPIPFPLAMALPAAERDAMLGATPPAPARDAGTPRPAVAPNPVNRRSDR